MRMLQRGKTHIDMMQIGEIGRIDGYPTKLRYDCEQKWRIGILRPTDVSGMADISKNHSATNRGN